MAVSQWLDEITTQSSARRFLEVGTEGNIISTFIDDIHDAILEYQVCKFYL